MVFYRAAVTAHAAGDRTAYIATFAHPVRCFYDQVSVPRKQIEAARAKAGPTEIHALGVMSAAADRVVLIDWGAYSPGEDQPVALHAKSIELTKVGDGSTITAEGAGKQNCGMDPATLAPPPAVARCREKYAADVKKFSSCKCGDGSNTCNACMNLLEGDVAACIADATSP